MEDYDKRQSNIMHPDLDHSLAENGETNNDTSSTNLGRGSVVKSEQSSPSVNPLKRRFSSGENDPQSPLTEWSGSEGKASISVNRDISALIHTGVQGPSREQQWNPSSALSLGMGVLQISKLNAPDTSVANDFPGGHTHLVKAGTMPPPNRHILAFQSPSAELVSVLPSFEVACLLVATYFDRAHWFILIFDREDFSKKWQQLYQNLTESPIEPNLNLDFTSTLLMVMVIGLQYVGPHRRQLLAAHNVDAATLKDIILATVRAKMMDIVSLGSLEAVQACVLLGTYYLYHGDPGLAWLICGCGLRIAQILNLHCKIDMTPPGLPSISFDMRQQCKTRNRSWWAIYEMETLFSMSYGYPQAIGDIDCDVYLLEPMLVGDNTKSQDQAVVVSYKYLSSKLSILTKTILNEMYGVNSGVPHGQGQPCKFSGCASTQHHLAHMASHFDASLQEWKEAIPPKLQLDDPSATSVRYASVEEMDRDIAALCGAKFTNNIYQFQALALEIAYQNARILVHRPLMAYQRIPKIGAAPNHSTGRLYKALESCRDAALKISETGSSSIFSLATDTHAVAFIGIQTFTAGVTLCILASIEPLTMKAHKSKMGLHRLLNMQRTLAPKSQLAAQGLAILEPLTKLVMEKELKQMLAQNDGQAVFGSTPGEGETQSPSDESINDFANFKFREDATISKALSDFDRAISGRMCSATDAETDDPKRQLFPERSDITYRFAQQQALIWGGDCLARFPGFAES